MKLKQKSKNLSDIINFNSSEKQWNDLWKLRTGERKLTLERMG